MFCSCPEFLFKVLYRIFFVSFWRTPFFNFGPNSLLQSPIVTSPKTRSHFFNCTSFSELVDSNLVSKQTLDLFCLALQHKKSKTKNKSYIKCRIQKYSISDITYVSITCCLGIDQLHRQLFKHEVFQDEPFSGIPGLSRKSVSQGFWITPQLCSILKRFFFFDSIVFYVQSHKLFSIPPSSSSIHYKQ